MMIWLSKNMLDMSDKIDSKVKNEGGPTVILTLPANGSEKLEDGSS